MASVSLSNVTKRFTERRGEAVTGLDGVSFDARAGEFLVLLGPSGCGKSTSLRILAGLEEPDSGEVRIGGELVNGVASADRGIAMVFQSYALFPHLTVHQNIEFGLRARRVSGASRREKVQWAAELLGLTAVLGRKPAQLSGGQRQRVALGRALVNEASVVLMDEPLSNLDATLRGQMRREIRALQRELGLTVVYVTHDQVEAMAMADRVAVMRNGQVEQVDTPSTLYRNPATPFVARFVGAPPMNLVEAEVRTEGLALLPSGILLTADAVSELQAGIRVQVGVRPESVRLGDHLPLSVQGEVAAIEDLGADTLVTLRLESGDDFVLRASDTHGLEVGKPIRACWDWPQTSVFPAEKKGERALVDTP